MSLLSFIGGIALALYLKHRNEKHERTMAVFAVEVEELKDHLALVNRAYKLVQRKKWDFENSNQFDGNTLVDSRLREAAVISDSFQLTHLTSTSEFNSLWSLHAMRFVMIFSLLDSERSTDSDVEEAWFSFNATHNELSEVIKQGLSNFRAGKSIYSKSSSSADPDSSYF